MEGIDWRFVLLEARDDTATAATTAGPVEVVVVRHEERS